MLFMQALNKCLSQHRCTTVSTMRTPLYPRQLLVIEQRIGRGVARRVPEQICFEGWPSVCAVGVAFVLRRRIFF